MARQCFKVHVCDKSAAFYIPLEQRTTGKPRLATSQRRKVGVEQYQLRRQQGSAAAVEDKMEDEDKEMCRNCKRDIPCSNYQMHTAHCARNIVLCLKCNEPIPKKQFQEHDCQEPPALETVASSHPVIPSSRPTALKAVAASHPTVIPSSRPAPSAVIPSVPNECQYCHLEFPGQNLEQHEDYCGSRTEQCPECSDYVMLKEWEKHQSMRLYHELAKKPSSLVFKREEDQSSISSSSRMLSSSYTTETRATATQLQSSRSMKNLSWEHRKWSQNNDHDSLVFGRSAATVTAPPTGTSSSSRRRSTSFTRQDDLEMTWNTSAEEQSRIMKEIQRGRSVTTHFKEEEHVTQHRSSRRDEFSSSRHHETTSSVTNFSSSLTTADSNVMVPPRRTKSVAAKETPAKKAKNSIVDRILAGGSEPAAEERPLLPFATIETPQRRPSRRRERRPQETTTVVPMATAAASVVDQYLRRSSTSRQPIMEASSYSLRRQDSASNLRRQDSMNNLNSLQDEINSMLTTTTTSMSRVQHQPRRRSLSRNRSNYEAIASSLMSEAAPRRRFVEGIDHTETHRENLRQMLCQLRKDPMDEDLEKCDGEYFPCEFCGDPYPVEFIMRHQLSCDLNPTPIQEGSGFDYSEIARRAAANMALARD